MMAHAPSIVGLAAAFFTRPISAFVVNRISSSPLCRSSVSMMSTSSSSSADILNSSLELGVSRLETLQKLLSKHGAPGSVSCSDSNDLVPVSGFVEDLHPHLIPIMKSESSDRYVCALKRASEGEDEPMDQPLPIVESGVNLPGMKLLALNSEHLMRRIACEVDDETDGKGSEIVDLYNEGLGSGLISDKGLDAPYENGSVAQLGYGVEKYVLLRVGPFPDLYEAMSMQHISKNSEESALIAAEASNGKFTGFGSTFAFHAKLLDSLPNRGEEAHDAARICLRLPLSTAGLTREDFATISRLANLAEEGDDSTDSAIAKLQIMYQKIRDHEQDDSQNDSGKTPQQVALDDANYVLDCAAMEGKEWSGVRAELGDIYASAGKDAMAKFVDPKRS